MHELHDMLTLFCFTYTTVQRITYKLCTIVYKCLHHALEYLQDKVCK